MSDPYNSYGTSAPPTIPSAAGQTPRTRTDPIARLDVSESWKRKFKLIEKAGGPDLPRFRDLPFGERFSLNFNILAFIFGPFYYLVKGLWRQAILFLIFTVALVLLLEVVGLGKLSRSVGYGFAAIYAVRANVSYYKKGSPPFSRTLTRRPIAADRSVHVEAKEVQCGVQAWCS